MSYGKQPLKEHFFTPRLAHTVTSHLRKDGAWPKHSFSHVFPKLWQLWRTLHLGIRHWHHGSLVSGDHNHIDKKLVCIKQGFHSLFSTYDTASTAKAKVAMDHTWPAFLAEEGTWQMRRTGGILNKNVMSQKQVMKSTFPCWTQHPSLTAESPQHIQNVKSTGHRCNRSTTWNSAKYTEISLQKCWVPARTTARKSQRRLVPSPWKAIVIAVIGSKARATLIRKELENFGLPKTWIEIAAGVSVCVTSFFLNHEVSKSSEPSNIKHWHQQAKILTNVHAIQHLDTIQCFDKTVHFWTTV